MALHSHERLPRNRLGTEPLNARSPLHLRFVLALSALFLSVIGAIVLSVASLAAPTPEDVAALRFAMLVCLVVAITSAIDTYVVHRRINRGDLG